MAADPSVDLDRFDPFSPAFQADPHPWYDAMRAVAPVFRVPGTRLHLVTRDDLVRRVVRDTATFSSRFGGPAQAPRPELVAALTAIAADGWPQVPTLLTEDPPSHTRYRKVVAASFNARTVERFRPAIEAIVAGVLDRLPPPPGPVDLQPHLSTPVPVEVIAAAMAVDPGRSADIKRWSDDSVAAIGSDVSDERRLEAMRGVVELQHFLHGEIEARRACPAHAEAADETATTAAATIAPATATTATGTPRPPADVIETLVRAELPAGRVRDRDEPARPLHDAELLSILQQLFVAGNETTTKLLNELLRLLGEHPAWWRRLQDDPSRIPDVVEEALRLGAPTQAMFRVVTTDTELGGVELPARSQVLACFAAANRDPAVWPDPHGFDPERPNLRDHLAFGLGTHFCVGAPLSRLETIVVLEQLTARWDRFELTDDNDFAYEPSFVLRGLRHLHVRYWPR